MLHSNLFLSIILYSLNNNRLYSLMLQDFRTEKWYTIFTEILTKTIQSATLSASVNDFVSSSIEALSPNIKISTGERRNILENLWKVFHVSLSVFQEPRKKANFFFSEFCTNVPKSNCTRSRSGLEGSSG